MKKLAIITTHPVQYYAPLFKLLQERNQVEIKVYYTWGEVSQKKHDPGFNEVIEWDLPLLDGYLYEWAINTSSKPGSYHFYGIRTPGLIKQVLAWSPDALLVFGWAYHSHLQIIRHFKSKLPLFFRGDSTLLDDTGLLKGLFKKIFLTWVYRHIDHAFYVGKKNKDYFLNYGLGEKQLSFAPHAVDTDRFADNRMTEALDLRGKLGLTQQNILILFAGKLERKKNPVILLNAFIKLNKPDVHLLIVGNGKLEKQLKAVTKSLLTEDLINKSKPEIAKNIHFMGFQNQTRMPVIYQICNLFCLPSSGPGETWGLAINEAMACGKAIIASDKVGAAADLIIENQNGCTFQSGNEADLLNKLDYLTNSQALLIQYGNRSKEIIAQWNFSKIAEAFEKEINESVIELKENMSNDIL